MNTPGSSTKPEVGRAAAISSIRHPAKIVNVPLLGVESWRIAAISKGENDGLRLYAPSVAGERDLQHYQLTSLDSVRRGPLHTMEPVPNGEAVSPQFDIILVPGIAFDRDGNRMGFGKGFYDRFLMEGSGIKIGICYDFQLIDKIPISEYDVPVDIVITEENITSIKKSV